MAMNPRNWPVGENQLIQPHGSSRPMTDIERGVIYLYLQKTHEIIISNKLKDNKPTYRPSNTPPPDRFAEAVRNFLREQLRGTKAYEGISPARDKDFLMEISNKLFKGMFFTRDGRDVRVDLDITQMAKRIAGLGKLQPTKNEIITALFELDDHLSENKDRAPGDMRYGEVKDASDSLWIVPSLGFPMPTPATIVNKLGKQSWFDVVEEIFGTDQAQARQRVEGIPLEMIKEDYLKLTAQMRTELGDDNYVPTHGDLIRRHKKDPTQISAHQYQQRLRYEDLMLNDLREAIGIDRRAHEDHEVRKIEIDWNNGGTLSEDEVKEAVSDAFINAWSHLSGLRANTPEQVKKMIETTQPPTQSELRDLSIENTKKINRGEDWVFAPDAGMVNLTFGGLNRVLAHIEKKYKVEISINPPGRLSSLVNAAIMKGLSADEMPKCVARQAICSNDTRDFG